MQQFIGFINNNGSAIEAIVAILNLILIGFLTFRTYLLQNKVQSMELYSRIQQESFFCQNILSDFIIYFENRANSTTSYLKNLFESTSSDYDEYSDLAQNSIKEYELILEILCGFKSSFQEFNNTFILSEINNKTLQASLINITNLKSFLTHHSPVSTFNSCVDGRGAIWLYDEEKYDLAFKETNKTLFLIKEKIDALT